jgi:hypothetical protein
MNVGPVTRRDRRGHDDDDRREHGERSLLDSRSAGCTTSTPVSVTITVPLRSFSSRP